MKITDIRIFPVDEPKLKAFVSIIFDHSFIVSDIKIIEGNKGLFLSMPSKKRRDGTFKDIAHPLNSETRKMMEDSVIAAYNEQQSNKGEGAAPVSDSDLPSDSDIPNDSDLPSESSAGVMEGGSF
jgi:stage V sporulation protein G